MSKEELCIVQREGPAAILQLNRPDRLNALSTELLTTVVNHLSDLDKQSDVRGVIITGAGRAFSAGADLNEALQVNTVGEALHYLQSLKRVTTSIENLSKPVVAAIDGICYTGGVELALSCDRRIGSKSSTFSVSSARIGSVAGLGGTQRLPRLIGTSAAKDLLMTGRVFDAPEAATLGFLDELVEQGQAVDAAVAWVEQCAAAAPLSVWMAKIAVNVGAEAQLETALALEGLLTALAFTTHDRREGMSAILGKRQAHFTGE